MAIAFSTSAQTFALVDGSWAGAGHSFSLQFVSKYLPITASTSGDLAMAQDGWMLPMIGKGTQNDGRLLAKAKEQSLFVK